MRLVKVEKGTIEFESYLKKIPIPFKIYADFESNLEFLKFMRVLTQKKNIIIVFLVVLFTKFFVLIIDLVSKLLFIEAEMLLMNLLKQFLKSVSTAKIK